MNKRTKPTPEKKVEAPKTLIKDYRCIACGVEDYTITSQMPTTRYPGQLPDGTYYAAVMRTRVRCNRCGQYGVKRSYELPGE